MVRLKMERPSRAADFEDDTMNAYEASLVFSSASTTGTAIAVTVLLTHDASAVRIPRSFARKTRNASCSLQSQFDVAAIRSVSELPNTPSVANES